MTAKIAVVIVNWNGWEDTIAAHQSLSQSEGQDWHLIVVDNASSDDSLAKLAGLTDTTLIANPRNDGFAGGCNVGIQAAFEMGSEFIFLLNNDATVHPDTLGKLLSASALHDGVVGCVVRFAGTTKLQFFGCRTGWDGAPLWYEQTADAAVLEQALIPSDFIFGAALFAKAETFRRIGLFDERFYLTYEETDWCYRARDAGLSCHIVRDAVVEHQVNKSLGGATSPLQAYFLHRNRLLFLERHASFKRLVRGVLEALKQARYAQGAATRRAMMIGIRDYFFRRFGDCPASIRTLARQASS
jgi:GT2 family glycosyltransferase